MSFFVLNKRTNFNWRNDQMNPDIREPHDNKIDIGLRFGPLQDVAHVKYVRFGRHPAHPHTAFVPVRC